jgi:hypothetical protein
MRRYLLVLDMDLLAMDEEHNLEPIEPKIHIERLAGAGIPKHPSLVPPPDHGVGADAEHRMNRAVQHLKMIGYQASGIISRVPGLGTATILV